MNDYTPNAGQTGLPVRKNTRVPLPAFTPAPRPEPLLPRPVLAPAFEEKGFILGAWSQHYLAGVTGEMLDWWWANMEKGYYLWAPGAHKRFSWVDAPAQVGFLKSSHKISEAMVAGKPVFGGDGVHIRRMGLEWYPFTTSLGHVIVEGIFNGKEELVDCTIHMWEDVPGGVNHLTASVINTCCTVPPAFVLECPEANPTDEDRDVHAEYECSRWPVFLPTLYRLWEGHPDPSQNVKCDLRVAWKDGAPEYICENGPAVL